MKTFLSTLLLIVSCVSYAQNSALPDEALKPRDRKKVAMQESIQTYLEQFLNRGLKKAEIQVAVKLRWRVDRETSAPMINLGHLDILAPSAGYSAESRSLLETVAGVDISIFYPAWMTDESMEAYKTQALNSIPLVAKSKINIWNFRTQQAPMTMKDYIDDPGFLKTVMVGCMFFLLVMVIVMLFLDNPAPTRVIVQVPSQKAEPQIRSLVPVQTGNVVRMTPDESADEDS